VRNGVLASTDENLRIISSAKNTSPRSSGVSENFLHPGEGLAGPTKVFELICLSAMANRPFGEVRVVLNVGLLVSESRRPCGPQDVAVSWRGGFHQAGGVP